MTKRVDNRVHFAKHEYIARLNRWKAKAGCAICAEDDPTCLDYHHRDPSHKIAIVSELVRKGSWIAILEEVNKCMVLCASCHRKLHAGTISLPEEEIEDARVSD